MARLMRVGFGAVAGAGDWAGAGACAEGAATIIATLGGVRGTASVTVDTASPRWHGHVGFVTNLIRRKEASPHGLYMLCGPEMMMRACIAELERLRVPRTNIYVSMERNMQCAAGFCGRCQYGPYFVCKDGPVFRYDRVAFLLGQEGF